MALKKTARIYIADSGRHENMPPFCLFASVLFYLIFQILKDFSHSLQHKRFSSSYMVAIGSRSFQKRNRENNVKKLNFK